MKIVVRIPNWIGDVVLSLPALDSLKKNFPQAQIWIATVQRVMDLFSGDSRVNGLISLPGLTDLRTLKDSTQRLKSCEFDIGLLLTNSFSSALLFYLAQIPQRWGYQSDSRSLLLTKGVPLKDQAEASHQVNYYLDLLSGLGLQTGPLEINLPISSEQKEAARNKLLSFGLDLKKQLVILNPGAYYGPAKRWPTSKFAELAALFQKRKAAEILMTGSAEDVSLCESVASRLERRPATLAGQTTLQELLGIISVSSLFVTNDTGPMHMANALRVPVVALFGPTDPRLTGPIQQPSAVIKKDVPCWPCTYRECPYDHRCMMRIEPEEVFLVSQKFLG